MMNLLSELSSSRSGMLRLVIVGITCIAILFLLWQALPAIDSIVYAQAYAYGNVSQGYMSQAEGARLLDHELQGAIGQVRPLALQALGVLAVAALLDIAIRKTERYMPLSSHCLKGLCLIIGVTLFFVACSPVEDPDSAIRHYSATLVADPNDATALVNRCAHYTASARYENAVADCTRALHLQPNSIDARQNRAAAYQRWGRFEEALRDWEEVLAQIETSEFWHKTSPERIEYARQQVRSLRAQLESKP